MGHKPSKNSIKIANNCDLYLNKKTELRPINYQINNGYYYIYFKFKNLNKNDNYLEFSYLNSNNSIEKDILSCQLYNENYNNIKVKNKKFIEYSLFSDKKRNIKIRLGNINQILYIIPINQTYQS